MDTVERVATVSVLQFLVWLDYAAGPGDTDDINDLL